MYLTVCVKGDETAIRHIDRWIDQAGGSLPLDELEQKFRERFAFYNGRVVSDEDWKNSCVRLYHPYQVMGNSVRKAV